MTDQAISPLRRRMIEDMTIRKLTPKTQQGYIRTINTPRNRCVRFVFGITAASRNTRFQAARCGLTCAGLAPADRASFTGAFRNTL
jgi:hypothetical protein